MKQLQLLTKDRDGSKTIQLARSMQGSAMYSGQPIMIIDKTHAVVCVRGDGAIEEMKPATLKVNLLDRIRDSVQAWGLDSPSISFALMAHREGWVK